MGEETKDKTTESDNLKQSAETSEEKAPQKENAADGQSKEAEEIILLKKELEEGKDKYLRLYSEFENFRRRTAKEKSDLIKTANEDVLVSILPILDDFERGLKSIGEAKESDGLREGINLIYNKLFRTLEAKGLKPMESLGQDFNPELHEAISQIPGPEDKKGKIVTEVEKGYYLHERVIRFAKVIIGS